MMELIWNELKEDWFIFSHNAVLVIALVLSILVSSCVGYCVGVRTASCNSAQVIEHVDTP